MHIQYTPSQSEKLKMYSAGLVYLALLFICVVGFLGALYLTLTLYPIESISIKPDDRYKVLITFPVLFVALCFSAKKVLRTAFLQKISTEIDTQNGIVFIENGYEDKQALKYTSIKAIFMSAARNRFGFGNVFYQHGMRPIEMPLLLSQNTQEPNNISALIKVSNIQDNSTLHSRPIWQKTTTMLNQQTGTSAPTTSAHQ